MELPAGIFLKALEDDKDVFAFRYDFGLEGKAVEGTDEAAETITELDNGDLLIEGYAAVFDGIDRQGENFAPGAFERGIKSFLTSNGGSLCYHHKHDAPIGKVLDLKEEDGKGLFMRARVDKQEPSSPLHYVYNGIKKGTIRGLSVGGFFKRAGNRIVDMDFTEISTTPVAVHTGPSFAVVAGKALEGDEAGSGDGETTREALPGDDVAEKLDRAAKAIEGIFDAFGEKALPATHDPKDARFLQTLQSVLSSARAVATAGKDDANDGDIVALADEIETRAAKWEAVIHKHAARVGPLPSTPY